jgi:hypothetical protein
MAAAAADSYGAAANGSNGSASMWVPGSLLDALSTDGSHSGGASPAEKKTGKRKAPVPGTPPKNDDTGLEGKWNALQPAAAAAAPSAAAAAAAAPRVEEDGKSSKPALFAELDSARRATNQSIETPLTLTELPTDWFVAEPDSTLVCCVCSNAVLDPPNLEVCGQLSSAHTDIHAGSQRSWALEIHRS